MSVVRGLAIAVVGVLASASIATGQPPDSRDAAGSVTGTIAAPVLRLMAPTEPLARAPGIRRFGVVTVVPPEINGGFVRVSVPVGELLMRASRTVGAADKEQPMKPDVYVKVVLTIIAGCLVAIVWRGVGAQVQAATPVTCTGDMKPTTTPNPVQASLGATYRIDVTCK